VQEVNVGVQEAIASLRPLGRRLSYCKKPLVHLSYKKVKAFQNLQAISKIIEKKVIQACKLDDLICKNMK